MKQYYIIFTLIIIFGCKKQIKPPKVSTQDEIQKIDQEGIAELSVRKKKLLKPYIETRDTVIIKDINELQNKIRSNRLIRIYGDEHLTKKSIRILNCQNLQIEGKHGTKILLTDPSSQTLGIYSSDSIVLKNIFLGHKVSPIHSCEQGVITITNSNNIKIDSCVLDGSGLHGLNINNLNNLLFINSKIQNCTNSIIDCQEGLNLKFEHSKFLNNFCHDNCFRFYGKPSERIAFQYSQFVGNKGESGDELGLLLFPHKFSEVTIEYSEIYGNIDMAIGLDSDRIINSAVGKSDTPHNK